MALEKIGPIGPEGPSRKKEKSSPDSDSFSDMMIEKTRKVGEVDPEEKKKRRLPGEEEEEELSTDEKKPTPYETNFYEKPVDNEEDLKTPPSYDEDETDGLPSSPQFWHDVSKGKEVKKTPVSPEDKKKKEKISKEEKKLTEEAKLFKKEEMLKKAKEQKGLEQRKKAAKEMWSAEERFGMEGKKEVVEPKRKTKEVVVPSDKKMEIEKKRELTKEEKQVTKAPAAPIDLIKEDKKKKPEKIIFAKEFTPPAQIEQTAAQAAEGVKGVVPTDVHHLFEYMVGTVIHIDQKGIERTQVILNSPAFANTKFYGSTVEIIRYSTAPNAYNIKLIGTPEAVNIFSANIDGLRETFDRGKFAFNIGRINAELSTEKPLFRRKEPTDQDKGGMSDER